MFVTMGDGFNYKLQNISFTKEMNIYFMIYISFSNFMLLQKMSRFVHLKKSIVL